MKSRAIDMVGMRFGRLIVTTHSGKDHLGQSLWCCACDCGHTCIRLGGQLRRFEKLAKRQSCGCWRDELVAERRRAAKTHGLTSENSVYPKLYDVWRQMLRRCEDKKSKDFPAYGGRGISVCEQWHDPHAFVNWCIASGYEEGLTIERQNVNGNYEPGNCTWIPNPMQSRNTRRNITFTFNDKTLCISEWSRYLDIHVQTLLQRLRNGWTIEQTLSTPPIKGRNQYGAP